MTQPKTSQPQQRQPNASQEAGTPYYKAEDLSRFSEVGKNAPALWAQFQKWYGPVFADGTLTAREKALMGLAVASAIQCPYCIDAYTSASLEKGANLEMMTEALHVAAAVRGGATLVHGVQMRTRAEDALM